jgi:hypothetical protein
MQQILATATDDGSTAAATGIVVAALLWALLVIIGWWKIFEKAGEAGWKSIIPFYNIYTMLRIVGQPGWMLIGFLIPFINIILFIIVMGNLAKSFGRGIGTILGLIFLNPIFSLILGFGSATYTGPDASQNQRF